MQHTDHRWAGHGIERTIPVEPDAVFAALTDVRGLPSWNPRIREILTEPSSLDPGAEWTVLLQTRRAQSRRRSVVVLHDPAARRFAHHSTVDGGDSSYTEWRWQVDEHRDGCTVRVGWVLRPVSARQRAVDPVRRILLRHEVRTSLAHLELATAEVRQPAAAFAA